MRPVRGETLRHLSPPPLFRKCGNDWVLVDPLLATQPDLYFDAPPSALE
jgi:hypothetical protein